MKKKLLSLLFIIFLIFPSQVFSLEKYLINIDTGDIIISENASEKTKVASLTKIITCITVLENIDDLNEEVTINNKMLEGLEGYAKLGLKVNDKITIEDLLYAMMLPSAADAAQALAVYTSSSIQNFALLMNEKTKEIGVKNSHFSNPVGMDDDNYSTAEDMKMILEYALKNPIFKKIFETTKYHIKSLNVDVEKTTNHYADLFDIDASIISGSKTGFTNAAGNCLATTSYINGYNYIYIYLNDNTEKKNYIKNVTNDYEYINDNYKNIDIAKKEDIIDTLNINNKDYNVVMKEDLSLFMDQNKKINKTFEKENIKNKIKYKDKIGKIKIYADDEVIYEKEVYYDIKSSFYKYVLLTAIIVLIIIAKPKKRR